MSDFGRNHVFDPYTHSVPRIHYRFGPETIVGRVLNSSPANHFRDGLATRQTEIFARTGEGLAAQMRNQAQRDGLEALRLMRESQILRPLEDRNRFHREAVEAHSRSEQLTRGANNLTSAVRSARERGQDRSRHGQDTGDPDENQSKPSRPLGSFGDWLHWSVYGGWPPLFRTRPNYDDPGPSDEEPDKPDDKEPNWQFETFKARVKEAHREDTGYEMSDDEFGEWLKRNGVAEEGFDLIGLAATGAIRGGKAVAKKVGVMAATYLSGEALDKFRGELAQILERYENKVRSQMGKGYLGQ